jgi:hypothetical protein
MCLSNIERRGTRLPCGTTTLVWTDWIKITKCFVSWNPLRFPSKLLLSGLRVCPAMLTCWRSWLLGPTTLRLRPRRRIGSIYSTRHRFIHLSPLTDITEAQRLYALSTLLLAQTKEWPFPPERTASCVYGMTAQAPQRLTVREALAYPWEHQNLLAAQQRSVNAL